MMSPMVGFVGIHGMDGAGAGAGAGVPPGVPGTGVPPGVPVLGLLEEDMEMSSRSSWDQSATELWSEISGIREKGDPCVGSVGFGRSGDS